MSADLLDELMVWRDRMNEAVKDMKTYGYALAEANRQYNKTYAETLLTLKANGAAATTVREVAKGSESVTAARMALDRAEVDYAVSREAIQAAKRNIDILDKQIDREWRG